MDISQTQEKNEDILSQCMRIIKEEPQNDVTEFQLVPNWSQIPILPQTLQFLPQNQSQLMPVLALQNLYQPSHSGVKLIYSNATTKKTFEKVQNTPKCDICHKEFLTKHNLKSHIREIHQGGRGQFTCGDCGQVYSRLRSLERHQNRDHLGEEPICKICNKKVVNYQLHYRKFHCKSKSIQVGQNDNKILKK